MSWDIFAQDLPADARNIDDIPDDFEPHALGSRSEIVGRILAVLPTVQFDDEGWAALDEAGCAIELNVGSADTVASVAIHVYGGDRAPIVVSQLLEQLGCRAFDPASTTGIFDASTAAASFARWREYRDRVAD